MFSPLTDCRRNSQLLRKKKEMYQTSDTPIYLPTTSPTELLGLSASMMSDQLYT